MLVGAPPVSGSAGKVGGGFSIGSASRARPSESRSHWQAPHPALLLSEWVFWWVGFLRSLGLAARRVPYWPEALCV